MSTGPKRWRSILLVGGIFALAMTCLSSLASAQSAMEYDQNGTLVPATLPHMYRYAFRVQNALEGSANKLEAKGDTVRAAGVVTMLQSTLRMTDSVFAQFRSASIRFSVENSDIEKQVTAAVKADKPLHPHTKRLSAAGQKAVNALYTESEDFLSELFGRLHGGLSTDQAKALDPSIIQFYLSGLTLPEAKNKVATGPSGSDRKLTPKTPSIFDSTKPALQVQPDCEVAYACSLPTTNVNLMFSADGKTVTAALTVTIPLTDEENGCWPHAIAELEQNNATVATAEADSDYVSATATTDPYTLTIGDNYTVGGTAESCPQEGDCVGALVVSNGFLTGPPSITSASISSGAAGSSGTITLNGNDLGGPIGNTPTLTGSSGLTVQASGPATYGLSSSNTAQSSQSVTYSISNIASAGDTTYQIQTVWGSTSTNFTIDCGAPSGIAVAPPTWNAGTTYSINVSGAGFCPTSTMAVSVTTGSVALNGYSYVSPALMTASVTPLNTDPTEPATITITNPSTKSALLPPHAAQPNWAAPPIPINPPPPVGGPSLGGGSSTGTATVEGATGKLYLLDPYPAPLSGSTSMSQTTIINNLTNPAVKAAGIITDGTSTAIAVYASSINTPVTFATLAGLILTPWNSSFLTAAPVASPTACPGTMAYSNYTSCTTATPIAYGGMYYSFALVQAPKQSNSVSYSSIQVEAGNVSWDQSVQYLSIYPTPVIFVHGLWGNSSSLSAVQSALSGMAPWSSFTSSYKTLSTLCYSISLPFDVVSDPAGSSVGQCTTSSQTSLNTQINAVLTTLDQSPSGPIVGGRVDLVTHSMGGLAARHFSAQTSLYKGVRNRMQGAFRTVITLDTPEIGSGLATFLLQPATAAGTCSQAPGGPCHFLTATLGFPIPATIAGTIWLLECKASATTNLATCLAASHQPLGPAGSGPGGFNISPCSQANASGVSPGCGAVASLQPTSPNIAALPSAVIPNSTWVAIDSNWPDNGVGPASLARVSLNDLIAALSLAGNPPPSTSLEIGSTENDVIVSLVSQSYNTGSVQRAEYLDRAHFSLGWVGTVGTYLSLGMANDDNVTNDTSINSCVGIILMTGVTATCPGALYTGLGHPGGDLVHASRKAVVAPGAIPDVDGQEKRVAGTVQIVDLSDDGPSIFAETREEVAARNRLPLLESNQRLEVTVPEGDAPLGRPITIPVHFAPGKLVSLNVTETVQNNNILPQALLPVHVTLTGGMPTAIEIVPAQLGSVKIDISAKYSDNAVASQSRQLKVVPSSIGIKQFSLTGGGHDIAVVLEDADQDRQASLTPTVLYADLKAPISLDDASQIKLSIEQDEANPVIRLDSNGLIHALREGTAVITGNFNGAVDTQTVRVYSREDAPAGLAKPKS